MPRPPLSVGTFGAISYMETSSGRVRAKALFRDFDGTTRPVTRWATSKAAAERALKEALRDRSADGGPVSADTRLKAAALEWLEDVNASEVLAHNTKELYARAVENYILPALGGLKLREVTVPAVDRALKAIKVQHGPGAAKTARSVLSGILGGAVRSGGIPQNPVRDASKISVARKARVRSLTTVETGDLLEALRRDPLALRFDLPDLVDWMLGTGMRIGETCAIRPEVLTIDTVEVNATVIRVKGAGLMIQQRPKTAAGWRVLALPGHISALLERRRLELRLNRVGVVFPSPGGYLRDRSNTAGDLRAALDRAGFPWVTSHTFRKTVATRLDEAGMSARQIADQLGHARPSLTQDVYMGRQVVSAEVARVLDRTTSLRPENLAIG